MNYAELIRRVPEWLIAQNRDLVDEMPNIVAQAHTQLVQLIDHDLFRTRVTGLSLDPPSGALDLEAEVPRIMEVRAISMQRGTGYPFTPLFHRQTEMLATLYATGRPGIPEYWTETPAPLQVRVYPPPARSFPIEIAVNVEPEVLGPGNATNVIGDRAERALEMATLRHAAIFMKDRTAQATYEGEMQGALIELNAQIARRRRDETGTRPRETGNATGT